MANQIALPPLNREPNTEILKYVRDIKTWHNLMKGKTLLADLRGLMTRVNSRGGLVFIVLHDATDSIQLVCNRSEISPEVWQRVKEVKLKDRLHVQGKIGTTGEPHNRLSVFVTNFRILLPASLDYARDASAGEQHRLTTQFFLARLRARATHYFHKADFVEFEPSYLSAAMGRSNIQPLQVVFPGFGANTYLAPSPASQLLEAIMVTGSPKVFCISRCFSAVIRDGFTSAESMILCARQLNASIEDMCTLSEKALKAIVRYFPTMPEKPQILRKQKPWPRKTCLWSFVDKISVESPEIHLLTPPHKEESDTSTSISAVFFVCWPPNVVIAEGHVEFIERDFSVGGVTLHLERMVPLLKDATLRRLGHLGL